jgi:hypothetical protein
MYLGDSRDIHPALRTMRLHFFPCDSVRICILEPQGSTEPEMVLDGKVAFAAGDTLSIVLHNDSRLDRSLIPESSRFVIRKSTPFGILEFDATGQSHWMEEELTLTMKLLGTHRQIQRRASCRIELRSEVRYCDLAAAAGGIPEWKTAELHDVSLGGASLSLQNGTLDVGHELFIEFALSNAIFSVPAVVRRVKERHRHDGPLYALEYLDLNTRQQDRMAKAIIQLQLKIISSRVKVD